MRITYDREADAAYVYLVDVIEAGAVASTRASMLEWDQSFIAFDFDKNDRLLGLEILGASRILALETIRAAERLDG